jgi:hypothetical protein
MKLLVASSIKGSEFSQKPSVSFPKICFSEIEFNKVLLPDFWGPKTVTIETLSFFPRI